LIPPAESTADFVAFRIGHLKGDAMHSAYSIALAGLFTLSSATTGQAQMNTRLQLGLARHSHAGPYSVQTASVSSGCFPEKLRAILSYIASQTRHDPMVTSGFRPHASRSGSLHRRCMAADIRVPGVSERSVVSAAQRAPGIGGIGTYCNGIIHVDIGPSRRWIHC
jgi:uncharacterized protein YcbK (DUF882 family)